jgi:hypothetical protein
MIKESPFILYQYLPSHPRRIGYERRAKIRHQLGKQHKRLVSMARRDPKAFMASLRPGDADVILERFGLSPLEFRAYVQSGRPAPQPGQGRLF